MYDYLVEWKNCGPEFNSWEPVEAFDELEMIQHYWKKKNKEKKKADTQPTILRRSARAVKRNKDHDT